MAKPRHRPLNIGHRGASAETPENTLAAFRRALEVGADGLELDLHLTRDGEVVVIHDDRVDRTTDGRGFVHEMSLAGLRRLDAGSWFNRRCPDRARPAFAGAPVPTLQEVFDLARPVGAVLYLEIKHGPGYRPALVERVLAGLAQNRYAARAVIECFDHTVLAGVTRHNPALSICPLFEAGSAGVLVVAAALGAPELAPHWTLVSPELVQAAHAAGRRVTAWTADDPAVMRALVAAGADAVITNFPSRLKQILDNDFEFSYN